MLCGVVVPSAQYGFKVHHELRLCMNYLPNNVWFWRPNHTKICNDTSKQLLVAVFLFILRFSIDCYRAPAVPMLWNFVFKKWCTQNFWSVSYFYLFTACTILQNLTMNVDLLCYIPYPIMLHGEETKLQHPFKQWCRFLVTYKRNDFHSGHYLPVALFPAIETNIRKFCHYLKPYCNKVLYQSIILYILVGEKMVSHLHCLVT